ncbi:ATP-binding protein [Nanoarchaeota archaeon]
MSLKKLLTGVDKGLVEKLEAINSRIAKKDKDSSKAFLGALPGFVKDSVEHELTDYIERFVSLGEKIIDQQKDHAPNYFGSLHGIVFGFILNKVTDHLDASFDLCEKISDIAQKPAYAGNLMFHLPQPLRTFKDYDLDQYVKDAFELAGNLALTRDGTDITFPFLEKSAKVVKTFHKNNLTQHLAGIYDAVGKIAQKKTKMALNFFDESAYLIKTGIEKGLSKEQLENDVKEFARFGQKLGEQNIPDMNYFLEENVAEKLNAYSLVRLQGFLEGYMSASCSNYSPAQEAEELMPLLKELKIQGTKKLVTHEIGYVAKKLPNPFEKGQTFPLNDKDLQEVVENIDETSAALSEMIKISRYIGTAKHEYSEPDQIKLCSRIFGHDLNNALNSPVCAYNTILLKDKEYKEISGEINTYLRNLLELRIMGLSTAYIASEGNEEFLMQIPNDQIEYAIPSDKKQSDYRLKELKTVEGHILNPECQALYQLVKNAKGDYTIDIQEDKDNTIITYQDNGPGILDEEGNPLQADRLHEIFGSFSTTGGGLGLQIAKALIELRGGWIDVMTKTKGNSPIHYNTETGVDSTYGGDLKKGTMFVMHVPKEIL